MFTESADIYDLVYSFKDYRKESEEIRHIIKSRRPDCKTILDIGCGTAEHHRFLSHDYTIDGIDINEKFISIASKKMPLGIITNGFASLFNWPHKCIIYNSAV